MKTDRRHELQTNELADWLGEHAKQYVPYAKVGIGIAVLLIAAMFAFNIMRGQNEGRRVNSWNEYFIAADLADLEGLRDLAERYKGTEAAAWAMQSAGDIESATGVADLLQRPAEAKNRLESARDAYQQALRSSKDELLLPRAHMGLAQVLEALNDFENAEKEYETVINKWNDSALANEARDRLTLLQKPGTKNFYDWFLTQKPKTPPTDIDLGVNVNPPAATDDLPNDPNLSLPTADDLERPIDPEMQPPSSTMDSEYDPTESKAESGEQPDASSTDAAPSGTAATTGDLDFNTEADDAKPDDAKPDDDSP